MERFFKLVLLIVLTAVSFQASAQMISGQSVEFEYDALGNRIVRQVWIYNQNSGSKAIISDKFDENTVDLTAFPNPATDQLTLRSVISDSLANDSFENLPTHVSIVNSIGQTLDQKVWNSQDLEVSFDVSQLPTGVYNVVIYTVDKPQRRKVIRFIHL